MLILYCASYYPYAKYDRSNSSYKCERVANGSYAVEYQGYYYTIFTFGTSTLEVLYSTYNCAAVTSHFKDILWLFIEPVYVQSFRKRK